MHRMARHVPGARVFGIGRAENRDAARRKEARQQPDQRLRAGGGDHGGGIAEAIGRGGSQIERRKGFRLRQAGEQRRLQRGDGIGHRVDPGREIEPGKRGLRETRHCRDKPPAMVKPFPLPHHLRIIPRSEIDAIRDHAILLTAALALEAVFSYPATLLRAIGHPAQWLGALIAALERQGNNLALSPARRRVQGAAALAVILLAAVLPAWVLQRAAAPIRPQPLGALALALPAASLFATRGLFVHVRAVATGFAEAGLAGGRAAVAHIVGRNPARLDAAGVVRAAIESLAENFSDAVVAPAFWCLVLGLPGLALYKAANTADSMLGHRTPRLADFGWASARFDDVLNLPAARLAGALLALAAAFARDASPRGAWRAMLRDARRHRSPNAGWPEAAMAGALGLRLAGPRVYGETLVADAWMGDGRAAVTLDDLRRALALYRRAAVLAFCAALCLIVIVPG